MKYPASIIRNENKIAVVDNRQSTKFQSPTVFIRKKNFLIISYNKFYVKILQICLTTRTISHFYLYLPFIFFHRIWHCRCETTYGSLLHFCFHSISLAFLQFHCKRNFVTPLKPPSNCNFSRKRTTSLRWQTWKKIREAKNLRRKFNDQETFELTNQLFKGLLKHPLKTRIYLS